MMPARWYTLPPVDRPSPCGAARRAAAHAAALALACCTNGSSGPVGGEPDGVCTSTFVGDRSQEVELRIVQRTLAGEVIDGQGMTLMPGMTEGHCHISFTGVASPAELGELPPEEHTLATMHNARLLFEHGFTSVYCAASAKPRLDVVIRNEIDAGRIPGPRIRAAR